MIVIKNVVGGDRKKADHVILNHVTRIKRLRHANNRKYKANRKEKI